MDCVFFFDIWAEVALVTIQIYDLMETIYAIQTFNCCTIVYMQPSHASNPLLSWCFENWLDLGYHFIIFQALSSTCTP